MPKTRLTSTEIELATARLFGWRNHIMVPNVYWGFDLRYEADLLILNKNNFISEIEIKTTLSDLKRDAGKRKHTQDPDPRIKYLYFAFPQYLLEKSLPILPETVGIITCQWIKSYDRKCYLSAQRIRLPKPIPRHRAITNNEAYQLMRLGCIRQRKIKNDIFNKTQKPNVRKN